MTMTFFHPQVNIKTNCHQFIFFKCFFIIFTYASMNNKISSMLLLVVGMLAVSSFAQINRFQCNGIFTAQSQIHVQGFCYELCANPVYRNCRPELLPPLPTSQQYCGLINGRWQTYTEPCEACLGGAIGFYQGRCNCDRVNCPDNQICNAGNCVNRPACPAAGCPFGQRCHQNNYCVDLARCVNDQCPLIGTTCISGFCFPFGAPCNSNTGCFSGLICRDGTCVADDRVRCDINNPCGLGATCQGGFCQPLVAPVPQCRGNNECPFGQACRQGRCRVLTCADVTCSPEDSCSGGICYRRQDAFCSRTYPTIVRNYCPNIRPTGLDCPNEVNPNPFNPGFCGVTNSGSRVGYSSYCQACKINNVIFVYNQPCNTVPQTCRPGQVCNPTTFTCGPRDLCNGVTCPNFQQCRGGDCVNIPNYCVSQNECRSGFVCQNNRCIAQSNPCAGVDCPSGQICNGGQCISRCALVRCVPGWTCYDGLCYQDQGDQCQHDSHCGDQYQCRNRKCCYDPDRNPNPQPRPRPPRPDNNTFRPCDQFTNCGINGQCVRGQCIALFCSTNSECGRYASCVNGRCQENNQPDNNPFRPCDQYTNCGINGQCVKGQCIAIICSTNSECGRYARCIDRRCQVNKHRPDYQPHPKPKPKPNPYPDPYTLTYPNPYSWQFPSPTPVSNNPQIYPVPVPPGTYPNPNYPNYGPGPGSYVGDPYGQNYYGVIGTYGNKYPGGFGGKGGHGGYNGGHDGGYGGGHGGPKVKRCPNDPCGDTQHCLGGICQTISTGAVCSTNQQCPVTHVCVGNYCRILVCDRDGDCFGHKCRQGRCTR